MDQNEAYQSILNALENSHSDTDISDLVDPPNMDPFELVDYWTGVVSFILYFNVFVKFFLPFGVFRFFLLNNEHFKRIYANKSNLASNLISLTNS